MYPVQVKCPGCGEMVDVTFDNDGELQEGSQTDGYLEICEHCGGSFMFSLSVDVLNKKLVPGTAPSGM